MTIKKVTSKQSHLSVLLSCFRPSLTLFRENDPLRMAGATAFFTTFAIPPIVFILAQLFGFFIGRRNVGRGLVQNISSVLGDDGAEQVRQVLRSIRGFGDEWYVTVIVFLFLTFVATTLFKVIKDSLNQIWHIGIRVKPGIIFILRTRFRSLVVILLLGILFFVDLFFKSMEMLAGNYLDAIWKGSGMYFKSALGQVASVAIVSAWCIMLFRFLADGRPRWKAALAGGLLAGILFSVGALILRMLLINSNIAMLYGAAGSFVLILLFVFYSSFILYYGACFVAIYSEKMQWPVMPNSKAYTIEK